MGGLRDLLDRIARGEISVDEGLHDMEEWLRPHPAAATTERDDAED